METVYSDCSGDDRRSFQFDVRTSQDGSRYLVIVEESGLPEPRQRSQITLLPEHLAGFQRCLREAIAAMSGEAVEAPKPPDRQGEKWSADEEEYVLDEFASGTKVAEIAGAVFRNRGAIRSRLKKLQILEADDPQQAARALLDERAAEGEE